MSKRIWTKEKKLRGEEVEGKNQKEQKGGAYRLTDKRGRSRGRIPRGSRKEKLEATALLRDLDPGSHQGLPLRKAHSPPSDESMAASVTTTGISVVGSMKIATPHSTGKRTRAACIPVAEEEPSRKVDFVCNGMATATMVGYRELLAAKDFIDLIITVDGTEFKAHRVVVAAASSYFRSEEASNSPNCVSNRNRKEIVTV